MTQFNFNLGQVLMTRGIQQLVEMGEVSPLSLLQRHQSGDFGDVVADDWRENQMAVIHGNRIFSSYNIKKGLRIWIITEADRSCTTLLLPDEY